jgi:hypothetical protein
MVSVVIRVRRRDFVSGSHNVTGFQGIAERLPRGVTISLLPGLTSRQRRAVIRRLRQEASRGCGPELPVAQLLIALFLDRIRGALRLAAGAVRLHPGTTLLPAVFVAAVMTLFVLASAGVVSVPAVRPALAAAQSGPGLGSTVRVGDGAGGLVSIGGAARDPSSGGLAAGGIRPSSIGAGGQGLGSGQPAPATGPRSSARPRAARVCFGAMPGVAAGHSPLACHRTSN